MNILPQSDFRMLANIPLDTDRKHQILFASVTAQTSYFAGKMVRGFSDFTYIRTEGNRVSLPLSADTLYECNYCMFRNVGFSNKWFYGYVTSIDYVNNNTTHVSFEVDQYQTWMFDYRIGKSFVEREHVSDDSLGANTMPEGLETGEYICTSEGIWNLSLGTAAYLVTSGVTQKGRRVNNVYTAVSCFGYSAGDERDLNHLIEEYVADPSNVAMICSVPDACIPYSGGTLQARGARATITPANSLDGYRPKNNKMLCYPYMFASVDNMAGSMVELRFEMSNGGANKLAEEVPTVIFEDHVEDVPTPYADYPTAVTSGNFRLTSSQQTGNAGAFMSLCRARGYSLNAVCAMLGNAQQESGINPGIWQDLTPGSGGFGMFQWTPPDDYFSFCTAKGLDRGSMPAVVAALEVDRTGAGAGGYNGRWIATGTYPLSFAEFATSTAPVTTLTQAFCYNFERAGAVEMQKRLNYAQQWYSYFLPFEGGEPTPPPVPETPTVSPVGYGSLSIRLAAIPVPKPLVVSYPENYKGTPKALEYAVTYDNFPLCPWIYDAFKQWMAYNGGTLALNTATGVIGGAAATGASLATGNLPGTALGAIGTFQSVYDSMKEVQYHSLTGHQLKGTVGESCMNAALEMVGIRFRVMTIRQEYAMAIDEFFTRYGYKVNRYKVPNLMSRNTFNYLKTQDCVLIGNIPNEARKEIERMYDNGLTVWHTTDVGNYSLENPIDMEFVEGGE